MKDKVLLLVFVALFVSIPFVAADTQINIKTEPLYKVSVFVLKPDEVYNLLESFHVKADSNGYAVVNYKGSSDEINVNVKVHKDGETLILEKFENLAAGAPL